jgi:transcriptional regulator with XRE-family HTH domain
MNSHYFGSNNMASIDGEKIRKLREAKGLTQLYLATFVGVTTDTISRWENRRYPNIKQENAEKLAEALEVELVEILENESVIPPVSGEAAGEEAPGLDGGRAGLPLSAWRRMWPLLLVVLTLVVVWQYNGSQREEVAVIAYRVLPPHIPAGEVFPVIINIEQPEGGNFPLIIKESVPSGCMPVKSSPDFTKVDAKQNVFKWISRTGGPETTIAYLARMTPTAKPSSLQFSGTVTVRDAGSPTAVIQGANHLVIADFHWADFNRDGRIDDEEILTVYDTYAALDRLGFDWDEVDEIWSGTGYRWDRVKDKFEILP